MLIAEEVGLYELSLVPQGACIGTSAIAASRWAAYREDEPGEAVGGGFGGSVRGSGG